MSRSEESPNDEKFRVPRAKPSPMESTSRSQNTYHSTNGGNNVSWESCLDLLLMTDNVVSQLAMPRLLPIVANIRGLSPPLMAVS